MLNFSISQATIFLSPKNIAAWESKNRSYLLRIQNIFGIPEYLILHFPNEFLYFVFTLSDRFNSFFFKIQKKFKSTVQITKPTNDYSQWSVSDILEKETDLAHVVEVSNFPSTFRTEDISLAFKTLT